MSKMKERWREQQDRDQQDQSSICDAIAAHVRAAVVDMREAA